MKFYIISLSLFICVTNIFSQVYFPSKPGLTVVHRKPEPKTSDTVIVWLPNILTFKNYTAINDTLVLKQVGKKVIKTEAATTTAILARFDCSNNQFHYEVLNLFSIRRSWFLKNKLSDTILLKHEQLHFDISELYARKIRKTLLEYPDPCGKEKNVLLLIEALKEKGNRENEQYDIEAIHGTNKEKQREWSERIKKELEQLNSFANAKGIKTI